MERAGFWVRFLAAVIDLAVGGMLTAVGGMVVMAAMISADVPEAWADWLGGVTSVGLALLYTSADVWLAATPGKLVLGLRIGTSAGGRAGRWTLALRWSAKYFALFLALVHAVTGDVLSQFLASWMNTVVIVGCLQALDESKRAWHDEWAGTAVLRRRPVPILPPPLPAVA
jgi:uncharacterized RDD family membrane protein YckC